MSWYWNFIAYSEKTEADERTMTHMLLEAWRDEAENKCLTIITGLITQVALKWRILRRLQESLVGNGNNKFIIDSPEKEEQGGYSKSSQVKRRKLN